MGIELITIDIDDTLVNSDKKITPRVKKALQDATEQGAKVVLATGRPLSGVKDYLAELGLADETNQFAITYNGSIVQTTAGEKLGDQHNDLTMIQQAGLGIAMANAVDEIKDNADFITTSQNDDGVGLAVEKWVLGKNVPELEK